MEFNSFFFLLICIKKSNSTNVSERSERREFVKTQKCMYLFAKILCAILTRNMMGGVCLFWALLCEYYFYGTNMRLTSITKKYPTVDKTLLVLFVVGCMAQFVTKAAALLT